MPLASAKDMDGSSQDKVKGICACGETNSRSQPHICKLGVVTHQWWGTTQ